MTTPKNILIIDSFKHYDYTSGKLNETLIALAKAYFEAIGCEVKISVLDGREWNVDEELALHQWADVIMLQFPLNWMGVPWIYKKYMDEIYTTGTDGRICNQDGRTRKDPSKQYGSGGTLIGKKYFMSMTANAPVDAFDDPNQYLFQGASVEELLLPMHANYRFFGMEAVPSFYCLDVVKNPTIEQNLTDFKAHLEKHFPAAT